MSAKERLSASVDADLLEAAEEAVRSGRASSVSAWVNDALRLKLAQERRLQTLAAFVRDYESEHGELTPDEVRAAAGRARARSVTVVPPSPRRGGRRARTARRGRAGA